jgi:hypothetical protein
MKELTPYEEWQLNKYGNVIDNISDEQLLENGIDQLERYSEWVGRMAEQELLEHQ